MDLSVLFLSRIGNAPGFGYGAHTHDYWHFTVIPNHKVTDNSGNAVFRTTATCWAPGEINQPDTDEDYNKIGINVMFIVHNKKLFRKLESISFESLTWEQLHIPVLEDMIQKIYDLKPGQEFVDCAFGYYLQLVLATCQGRGADRPFTLTEKALDFIEENYMHQIRLDDVAEHIGRTPSHTSHLVKAATGITVVEHVREVRIKNACRMLAYSNVPLEDVISSCGFVSESYFHRIFREKLGTTPNRYRTSHSLSYTFYCGEDAALDIPYNPDQQFFTYIPGAQKCVDWKTPRAYFTQTVDEPKSPEIFKPSVEKSSTEVSSLSRATQVSGNK